MGRQSARLYFQGKDHKDIYFNGHYHDQMYLSDGEGNVTLVWEKIKEGIFKFLIMPIDTFEFEVQGSVHIDWGDGESSDFESMEALRICRHSYTKSAKFMVQIRGDIQNIRFWSGYRYSSDALIEILTKLPKTMEKITQLTGLCYGDTRLERIPAGLFDNCPNAESFGSTFSGCSGLECIPAGLFKNCPEAVQFQYTFAYCTGLTSIPSDIFADSINASDFGYTFFNCSNLTYIPGGLFDGRPNVESFEQTFNSCDNVVSNVPELWKTHESTKEHTACFHGCDKAENFKDIPASWYYFH